MKFIKPDVDKCRQAFEAIDTDKSGTLDIKELITAFAKMGINLTHQEFLVYLSLVDQNGDAQMNFEEFRHFMYILQNASLKDKAKIIFLSTDSDCSGTIDKKELARLFKKLELNISEQKIGELVESAADQKDGTLSYEMFQALVKKISE
ncbi:EF_hand domain-containing protein [Hexamita inflata]|uniref:EF hand domain-containing protein n=1 Tax=Hexamita inflata TaxID=28002 RepID=A0AA86PG59_9EUKA|nr:EF hand domain-containing protein [Hexamita inflata]